MNYEQLAEFARHAQAMISAGAVEDQLRHYLSSRLTCIFPDCPWWIQAHMEGTEAHVRFSAGQQSRDGFVDAVVGKTAIEYEKNLMHQSIFSEGYRQVKAYCAALYNFGIPESEIRGVLSDTVRWFGYSVTLAGEVPEGHLCGPDDIDLHQVSAVDLSKGTDTEFQKFEGFVGQFLDRAQSRLLNAGTLVMDFGVESSFYHDHIPVFRELVTSAMAEKPDYAELIRQVWQNFIAYLGASEYGSFSLETYINEFYLVTVAKMICVNVMAGKPVKSEKEELLQILNGAYFTKQSLYNFVDYDYFGWLNSSPYGERLVSTAASLQDRLAAYDFSRLGDNDLFGRLLAQLAAREHRLMLGQEFTPHWVAREIAEYNLDRLQGTAPRIVDMCCGSGVFLIESIKAVRRRYQIVPEAYSPEKDDVAFSCVMGFDIDPLAVMLAKVNWVMSMRDLFPLHHGDITVPIYHADSLFVSTPITHQMPGAEDAPYVLHLGRHQVTLPAFLLSPAYRKIFDALMAKAYRLAMARAAGPSSSLEPSAAEALVAAVEEDSDILLSDEYRQTLLQSVRQLVSELEQLQRDGLNGIWYFLICNSYRPGLTEKQFNCMVSNPPWLAMSKLADNPYKTTLRRIACRYKIKPAGASHPHMELATIFLLSAVDRYLEDGACWSCVMPGSLLSGLNHEPLRQEAYRSSSAALSLQFDSIWDLPQDTFKNKAIVLSGRKSALPSPAVLKGRVYTDAHTYTKVPYTLERRGRRSAWTSRGSGGEAEGAVRFTQGCDLFPRTALFHTFSQRPNGKWDIAPIQRNSELWYLVNDRKKPCLDDLAAENFDGAFLYDALISKHLSPFFLAPPAKVLMPGKKTGGQWTALTASERALMNSGTAYVFNQLEAHLPVPLERYLLGTGKNCVNIYGKLLAQDFSDGNWLVLSSAGGSNPCAAYLPLKEADRSRLVIDQTLYWHLAGSEDEAVYLTGLLNSDALADAIRDFQPEGGFGRRHIHTLPYQRIPPYDPAVHGAVVAAVRALVEQWAELCRDPAYAALLRPDSGSLNRRRPQQQEALRALGAYGAYEAACREVLC